MFTTFSPGASNNCHISSERAQAYLAYDAIRHAMKFAFSPLTHSVDLIKFYHVCSAFGGYNKSDQLNKRYEDSVRLNIHRMQINLLLLY